jgi:hypothetical protein
MAGPAKAGRNSNGAARERDAAEQGAGKLAVADEAEAAAPQPGGEREKKKTGGRPATYWFCLPLSYTGTWKGSIPAGIMFKMRIAAADPFRYAVHGSPNIFFTSSLYSA